MTPVVVPRPRRRSLIVRVDAPVIEVAMTAADLVVYRWACRARVRGLA